MTEPIDLLVTPWRHLPLPTPPRHPVNGFPPLAKAWLPPLPGCVGRPEGQPSGRTRPPAETSQPVR